MRVCRRRVAAMFLSGTMLLLPLQPSLQAAAAQTGDRRPVTVAVVGMCKLAHVGPANLVSGTDIYSGDTVRTDAGGELRLTVGDGQVFLLSASAAKIGISGAVVQATLLSGTIGFASLTDRQFQVLAPEGLIEAAYGQPAYGQVTFTGPNNDIVVSAFTGALVLHRGDQTLVVKAGQSYYVSLVADPQPQGKNRGSLPYTYHLEWRLVVVAAAAGVGYYLWQFYSISPVVP